MTHPLKLAGWLLAAGLLLAACSPAATLPAASTATIGQPAASAQPTDTQPPATLPLETLPPASQTPETLPASPTRPVASATAASAVPSLTPLPSRTPAASPQGGQPPATQPPAANPPPSGKAIIIDHTSVALFDRIPDEYLEKARSLRVVFYNASVGNNISQGLDCLASSTWAQSPSHCRRDYTGSGFDWRTFTEADLSGGSVPARIQFPGGAKYDRSNWAFERHASADWQPGFSAFLNELVPGVLDRFDVLSYKVTYFMVDERSDINNPQTGFFAEQPNRVDVTDLQAFAAEHPDKMIFYWSSSLSRTTGSQVALDFNQHMRDYAAQQGLILFDIADIESHTDTGAACFDNRDGIEYCSNNGECENFPDDGRQLPAICSDYTTEIEGGHLGSVSGGKIQLAKAFWVLIARMAGWKP